jgi:hypothetical protein
MVLVRIKANAHKGLGYDDSLCSLGLYARFYWLYGSKLAPKVTIIENGLSGGITKMIQNAKIAISLPKELLQQCDQIARELKETRSALIQTAIRDMVEKYKQKKVLLAAKEIYDRIADSDLKLNEAFLSISSETVWSNSAGDENEKNEAR